MDELIARLVANVGIDRTQAERAVGIIFDFLRKEGPADKVQALIDRLPILSALTASPRRSSNRRASGRRAASWRRPAP